MKQEPTVDLELSVASSEQQEEQVKADLRVSDPSDGEAILERLRRNKDERSE